MATFVHLLDANDAKSVLRSGIRASRFRDGTPAVFCVPVVPSFQMTFQWLRELKRRGHRTACAVQFKIGDDELVSVGRFGERGIPMRAAEAVAHFLKAEDARGLEVKIGRSIRRREIVRVRALPQIVGWRFYPEAKGSPPLWPAGGSVKAGRLRQAVDARNKGPWER